MATFTVNEKFDCRPFKNQVVVHVDDKVDIWEMSGSRALGKYVYQHKFLYLTIVASFKVFQNATFSESV